MRVAVIDYATCKPDKCRLECIRLCPINRSRAGPKAVELSEQTGKPVIREDVCIGCNICVKKCPFSSIEIENVPDELEKNVVHRYGRNAFKLYGLPVLKVDKITGLIGKNGTGKTTCVRILSGELVPNLGGEGQPSWDEVIRRFRGTELQAYFEKLANGKLRAVHKVQHVDLVPRVVRGRVGELLERADERGLRRDLIRDLGLEHLLHRSVAALSGGELQKFLIAVVLAKDAHVYIFDEPSSYLDVSERLRVARAIRNYLPRGSYALVVEHDLTILDYLSDLICVVYGEPGVFGVVSSPYGARAGVNHFLEGYLPAENMRIRREPIKFHATGRPEELGPPRIEATYFAWGPFRVKLNGFSLEVRSGSVGIGEVMGIIGPNGIGKTTLVRAVAGHLEEDSLEGDFPRATLNYRISYKPQYVTHSMFEGTVGDTLKKASQHALSPGHWHFEEVVRPLKLAKLREREVKSLSGGELQKLAIAVALLSDADLYLLDEPSAYLDVEERLLVAKVLKRMIAAKGAAAFVVEHDMSIVDYLCDRVIVIEGEPGVRGLAREPAGLRQGMNEFLKMIGVTFRRDMQTGRPRINKEDSYLDRLQKKIGEYYYVPREGEAEEP
ncbi:MAG: ribosome biogenesis/translation initiation ATPase RLI [Fervidicoccaceae archaeon]